MPGIEVTETKYHDQPQAGYPANPPPQQGQYPPQGPYQQQQQQQYAYPPQGPYQQQQQQPWQQQQQQWQQPPPQQWGPPGGYQQPGQVEYGFVNRPGSTRPVFVAPADMDDSPIFVGTSLPGPFQLECGPCGYRGDPSIRSHKGCGFWMILMMTFGLSLLCYGWGSDTLIVCPRCNKVEGVAKIM